MQLLLGKLMLKESKGGRIILQNLDANVTLDVCTIAHLSHCGYL